ncbi:MAG: hypothetical protein JO025_22740 [Verrucomicrobia bacterium]|nr:hypothetical protein [Verrucomicrobiota bacterium]
MKAVELGRSRGRLPPPEGSDGLFGWTVVILLLCGVAVVCWIGTFYVFDHPEQPFNYQLLAKLNKVVPPKRFELTAAPAGEFLGSDKLLERYGAMTATGLQEESNNLIRSFLRNYDHQVGKVPYITGKYTVLDAFPMSENQYFGSGVVALAQSNDVPTIYVEAVFPGPKEQLASMQRVLVTGLGLELRRSFDLTAIVHITNLGGGRLLFTCMPLLYSSYGQSGSSFQLEPPAALYVKAGLPLVSNNQFEAAETRFAQYRRAAGSQVASTNTPSNKVSPSNASPSASVSNNPTLVAALRAAPVSTPTPALLAKQPHASPTPKQLVVAATPANRPTATPTPTAPAVAETTPQPFLAASASPGAGNRIGSWQLFKPGLMPRGRLFDVSQTAELADKGIGTEPIYLKGEFTVTAARENRAVLRPKSESNNAPGASIRIIVEFPKGGNVPKEGDPVARLNDRPFQIEDVRKGADGQVNIYVREITVE